MALCLSAAPALAQDTIKIGYIDPLSGGGGSVGEGGLKIFNFLAEDVNASGGVNGKKLEIVPFDEAQVRAAAVAFDRYGKGINSKAQLNLSDCAAYALAKTMNAPLLFKGNDFTHTDITSISPA